MFLFTGQNFPLWRFRAAFRVQNQIFGLEISEIAFFCVIVNWNASQPLCIWLLTGLKKKTKYSEYYFPADGSEINLVEINKKEDLQK